jgi:hypothetical protein
MCRKSISMIVIVTFLSLVLHSCSSNEEAVTPKMTSLEDKLRADSRVDELIQLESDLIAVAMRSDATSSQLREAWKAEDRAKVAALFGFNQGEWDQIAGRIVRLGESLRQDYPELNEQVEIGVKSDCASCDVDELGCDVSQA